MFVYHSMNEPRRNIFFKDLLSGREREKFFSQNWLLFLSKLVLLLLVHVVILDSQFLVLRKRVSL